MLRLGPKSTDLSRAHPVGFGLFDRPHVPCPHRRDPRPTLAAAAGTWARPALGERRIGGQQIGVGEAKTSPFRHTVTEPSRARQGPL